MPVICRPHAKSIMSRALQSANKSPTSLQLRRPVRLCMMTLSRSALLVDGADLALVFGVATAMTDQVLEAPSLVSCAPHAMRPGAQVSIFLASAAINILAISIPISALLIYDRVLPNGVIPTLGVLLSGLVVIIGFDTALRLARNAILTRAGARLDHIQRDWIMRQLLKQRRPASGGLPLAHLTSAMSAGGALREYRFLRIQAIVDIPFGVAFLLTFVFIGGWLALIPAAACVIFALVTLAIAFHNERAAHVLYRHEQERLEFAGRIFADLPSVHALAAEIPIVDKFVQFQIRRASDLRNQIFGTALGRDIYSMFSQVLVGSVVLAGTLAVLNGQLSLGGLAACTLLAGRALEPLQTAFLLLAQSRQRHVAEAEIGTYLQAGQTVEELASLSAPRLWDHAPGIKIAGLTIARTADTKPLLENLDLDVEPGEVVMIKGDRGEGKTTLARAMLGMVPTAGKIRIGGILVDRTSADTIRRNVTYLSRDPDLPSGRLIDVLTDGDEDTYADVRYLSHLTGLDDAVKRLPAGYDTVFRPDIITLPAGFRQQLAIVRGLAKKHKLIVVDDATFVLDAVTEMRLVQLIKMLKGEATFVLFTDRPSFRVLADKHFVLVNGGVVAAMSGQA